MERPLRCGKLDVPFVRLRLVRLAAARIIRLRVEAGSEMERPLRCSRLDMGEQIHE